MVAYAVAISPENMSAIASEHPKFNKAEFEQWLHEHEGGYFVRDENSRFDCSYIDDTIFSQFYLFESGDTDALFRRIVQV